MRSVMQHNDSVWTLCLPVWKDNSFTTLCLPV